MTQTIANVPVDLDAEGYLTDPTQWTPDVAREIAAEYDIDLTDKHFEVIEYLRSANADGAKLSIRRIGKSGIVDIKGFYDLFPGGPLKVSSRIAGIPKPASCV
ncbi:MAG: TusE/DsrC/DsvC family sulfur relay protein [Rhodothermales bacterium]|nr:TusE/DsrC/DsvC family sulfur relay protein [Rhodothermales bacterium]